MAKTIKTNTTNNGMKGDKTKPMTRLEKKRQLRGYKSIRDLERAMGFREDSISQWMYYHHVYDIGIAIKCMKKPKKKHRKPIQYKGKTFKTKTELAKYLNVDSRYLCLYLSKHKDMNIEDAIKSFKNGMHRFTFNGKKYKSKTEMFNDLDINPNAFKYYYYDKKMSMKLAVKMCLEKSS